MDVSVIVVSHGRLHWLNRCLTALRQLDYPSFEIVVVADTASLQHADTTGLKTAGFDTPNISAARNLGLRHAAGAICAFLDDDAVPEPLWLSHITQAFEKTGADAVVGYVRGRNGISFQSRIATVDAEAETHEEPVDGDAPFVPVLKPGRALKLVGTNMAFRRSALEALGGFDEAFRYYLDDTDISLRLAQAGKCAAVAPLAEVHHAFASSGRRTAMRAPTDLFDIGRSSALYFRRHGTPKLDDLKTRMTARERARLVRHMVLGNCEPRDIHRLLSTLNAGWVAGLGEDLPILNHVLARDQDFSPVQPIPSGHIILSSRLVKRHRMLKSAAEQSQSGHRVSLFSFSLTPIRHHVRYSDTGFWVQTGGQFGRSKRQTKRFRWCRFASRIKEEIERVAKVRGI
jgi:GT2 family glycosyltransferase